MSEKPWKEMTPAERSAHMHAGRQRKAEERAAAETVPIVEPEAPPAQSEPDRDFFAPVELSDQEVLDIRAWALAQAKKEQKDRKIAAMKDAALAQAREQMGLVTMLPKDAEQARLAELVSHTINLPEGGGPDGVRIDQQCFRHGVTYTVTRAVYETIIDIENRAWMSEALFDGKARNHYNKLNGRFQAAYGGGTPAGSRLYHAGA